MNKPSIQLQLQSNMQSLTSHPSRAPQRRRRENKRLHSYDNPMTVDEQSPEDEPYETDSLLAGSQKSPKGPVAQPEQDGIGIAALITYNPLIEQYGGRHDASGFANQYGSPSFSDPSTNRSLEPAHTISDLSVPMTSIPSSSFINQSHRVQYTSQESPKGPVAQPEQDDIGIAALITYNPLIEQYAGRHDASGFANQYGSPSFSDPSTNRSLEPAHTISDLSVLMTSIPSSSFINQSHRVQYTSTPSIVQSSPAGAVTSIYHGPVIHAHNGTNIQLAGGNYHNQIPQGISGVSAPISKQQKSNKWTKSTYIDERGGQLSIDGSCARLKIPPGALPKGQGKLITVSLDWVQDPPLQDNQWVIGPSIQCEPDGLQFNKPVTISLEHSAVNITTGDVIIISKSNTHGPRNTWQVLYDEKHMKQSSVAIKLKDNVIKLRVKHFSWYKPLMELFRGRRKPAYLMVMLPFLAPKTLSKATRKVVLRIYSSRQDAEKKVDDYEAECNSVKAAPPVQFLLDPSEGDLVYSVKLDTYSSSKWTQENNNERVLTKKYRKMQYNKSEFVFEKKTQVEVGSIHGCLRGIQGDEPCVTNTNFSYDMYGNASQDEHSDVSVESDPDGNKEMAQSSSKSDSDFLPVSEKAKSHVKARTDSEMQPVSANDELRVRVKSGLNIAQQRELNRKMLNSATDLLCQDLKPESLQPCHHKLQSQGILSQSDVENITSHGPTDKRIETLLNILKWKPSGYECFMEVLQGIDTRLHDSVRHIEMDFINEHERNMHMHEDTSWLQQVYIFNVLHALPTSQQREIVRYILSSATEFLCENLEPTKVIRKLQSHRDLDDSDVANIKSIADRAERVEKLLFILKRKSVKAYVRFMEALWEVDKEELYKVIMEIMQGRLFPNETTPSAGQTTSAGSQQLQLADNPHELFALPSSSSPTRLDQPQSEINNNLEDMNIPLSSRSILERLTEFLVRSGPMEEQDDRLQANCAENGLQYRGITPGNGDCFFEAVADQLDRIGNQYRPIASCLRQDVSNYMAEHRVLKELDGDVDLAAHVHDCDWGRFCESMSKCGEWANHVVAVCAAHMLQIPIIIIMSSPSGSCDSNILTIKGGPNAAHRQVEDSILLGHRWENHYQSLEPI
ncbi:uncharacterized protein [Amphiura filiformis]|uniref:uncharacterized protein n=1 Tax=Amphiura filiformis TaxID=82378 RepID=UPI003B22532A